MAWQKGVAQTVTVTMYAAGEATAPTGAVSATISKDGGDFGAVGGSVAQIQSTPQVLLTLNTDDMDCDTFGVRIVDAGGACDDRYIEGVTEANYTAAVVALIDVAISSRSTYAGGAVASVSGSVGSVAGNVDGNVTGSVGSVSAVVSANLTQILGTALTETVPGYIAAAFKKLFDVATPLLTAATAMYSSVMRGTDSAALASVCTEARLAELDAAGLPADVAAVPTAAEIDIELSTQHGSGVWGGAAGSGSRTVTVTVTDGTDPQVGVNVTITNQAETATAAGPLTTDANGQAVFYLDDAADYRAVPATTPLLSGGATNFTVSGATAVTCAMTAATLPTPAPASYCNVNVLAQDEAGANATGTFEITKVHSPTSRESNNRHLTVVLGPNSVELVNGANSLTILQGAVVDLKFTAPGKTVRKNKMVVPAQSNVDWEDLVVDS